MCAVVVYAKASRGFQTPSPEGNYDPNWAVAFKEDRTKRVHFVAETNRFVSSMGLRKTEGAKVASARKFSDPLTADCASRAAYQEPQLLKIGLRR